MAAVERPQIARDYLRCEKKCSGADTAAGVNFTYEDQLDNSITVTCGEAQLYLKAKLLSTPDAFDIGRKRR